MFTKTACDSRHRKQQAQLLLRDRATRKPDSFWDTGRGNDNLHWSDLQMSFKVIKSNTDQKYDFLLIVYSSL